MDLVFHWKVEVLKFQQIRYFSAHPKSDWKPNLVENVDGSQIVEQIYTTSLNKNDKKRCSRNKN